jgi:hypothetical protein
MDEYVFGLWGLLSIYRSAERIVMQIGGLFMVYNGADPSLTRSFRHLGSNRCCLNAPRMNCGLVGSSLQDSDWSVGWLNLELLIE